jgi:hypothetical protein
MMSRISGGSESNRLVDGAVDALGSVIDGVQSQMIKSFFFTGGQTAMPGAGAEEESRLRFAVAGCKWSEEIWTEELRDHGWTRSSYSQRVIRRLENV